MVRSTLNLPDVRVGREHLRSLNSYRIILPITKAAYPIISFVANVKIVLLAVHSQSAEPTSPRLARDTNTRCVALTVMTDPDNFVNAVT